MTLPHPVAVARVLLLYLAAVAASVLVGRVAGADPLGVLFGMGVVLVLWSVALVRGGGEARWRLARADEDARFAFLPRIRADLSEAEKRRAQIRRGMGVFSFAMALWLTVLLLYRALGPRPFA